MDIKTIESNFEYQAKRILLNALRGSDIKNLNDVEEFKDEIWKDRFAIEIGRKFIDGLADWSGDDMFEETMEELAEEQR